MFSPWDEFIVYQWENQQQLAEKTKQNKKEKKKKSYQMRCWKQKGTGMAAILYFLTFMWNVKKLWKREEMVWKTPKRMKEWKKSNEGKKLHGYNSLGFCGTGIGFWFSCFGLKKVKLHFLRESQHKFHLHINTLWKFNATGKNCLKQTNYCATTTKTGMNK